MTQIEQVARLAVDWTGQRLAEMTPEQRAMYDLALLARWADAAQIRTHPQFAQLAANVGGEDQAQDVLAQWLSAWERQVTAESAHVYEGILALDQMSEGRARRYMWSGMVVGWTAVAACLGVLIALATRGCGL